MNENKKVIEKISIAFFLLFIGTLLLLNNFGYLQFSNFISLLITYWPLLIIFAGYKIIINALPFGKIIDLIINILVYILIGILLVSFKGKDLPANWIPAQGENSKNNYEYTIQPEEPVTAIDYKFNIGASTFNLSDTKSNMLFDAKGTYYNNAPEIKKIFPGVADERSSIEFTYLPIGIGFNLRPSVFDILVSDSITTSNFDIKLGAGEGFVRFDNITLGDFDMTVGAGNLETHLNSPASTPKSLDIKVGAGNITLYVPNDVKISLKYSVGAGMITVHDITQTKEFGGLAKSGKFESTGAFTDTININASVGAGNIDIYHE